MQLTPKLKYLFLFRKPVFTRIDFVDIVIEDKPLLLVAWQIADGHSVKILPLKKRFRTREGSYILLIPRETQTVQLVARNIWRKTRHSLTLQQTVLDENTSQEIIRQFKPLSFIDVRHLDMALKITKPFMKKASPVIESFRVKHPKNISITVKPFIYP